MIFKEGEVDRILMRLDVHVLNIRGDEILGLCPGHEARTGQMDHNPSWSINAETGIHHCFSCGFKGSILTLIAEMLEMHTKWGKLDVDAAKSWLRNNTEVDLDLINKQLSEMRDAYVALPKPVEMSEARLAVYTTPPEWALDERGLTAEACATYGVKWNEPELSWITPIRSEAGKLMGWQEKGQTNRIFRNRPAGVAKSTSLFGLDAFDGGTMIVVESPLDAVRLKSVGIDGGVATYGAIISDDQLALMRKSERLIFALDNARVDPAGKKALEDMLVRTRAQGMECWFFNYNLTDAKDPGDMSAKEIQHGVKTARHSAHGKTMLLTLG